MAFSAKQVRALRRKPDHRHVRTRQAHDGRQFSYLEGWYAISEANRIFGFDGWSRETLESRCVRRRAQPLSARAMAPEKVGVCHLARCMTLPLKPPRPMPPSGRWPLLVGRSGLSSIGAADPYQLRSPSPHYHPLPGMKGGMCSIMMRKQHRSPTRGSQPVLLLASIRMTPPLFHGPRASMAGGRIWSPVTGRKYGAV